MGVPLVQASPRLVRFVQRGRRIRLVPSSEPRRLNGQRSILLTLASVRKRGLRILLRLVWKATLTASVVLLSAAPNILAATGDTIYVQKARVNLREGPSTQQAVVMQLSVGQRLLEFGRKGDWVQVGVERTGGKTGWIHSSLVGPRAVSNGTSFPVSAAFKRFKAAFDALNEKVRKQTGLTFFTGADDLGDGIIQITATETWLSGPKSDRESNLRTVFNMWDAADNSSLPIAVYVIDRNGNHRMSMTRR